MRDIIEFLQSRGRRMPEEEPVDPALFKLPPREKVACFLGEILALVKYYPKEHTLDRHDLKQLNALHAKRIKNWTVEQMRFIIRVYLNQEVYEKTWIAPKSKKDE